MIECALAARGDAGEKVRQSADTDAMECNWRSWDTLCGIRKDY